MAVKYARQQVLDLLRNTLAKGEAIITAGAGAGISAKFAEVGGADLIVIYNSGRFRMSGHGSMAGLLAFSDANALVVEMSQEVLPVVKQVPVIAGVNATDPMRQMPHFLMQLSEIGFSGVNNFPTVGVIDGVFRQGLEETGFGFYKEVDMVRIANEMDIFSIVYVFNPEESRQMAEAGADVIIAHMGTTVGGTIGVETAMGLEDAAANVQEIIDAAKAVNTDVIALSHGGPIATPEDAAYINQHTDAVGFVGASSIERLAVEKAITEMTQRFKRIPVK